LYKILSCHFLPTSRDMFLHSTLVRVCHLHCAWDSSRMAGAVRFRTKVGRFARTACIRAKTTTSTTIADKKKLVRVDMSQWVNDIPLLSIVNKSHTWSALNQAIWPDEILQALNNEIALIWKDLTKWDLPWSSCVVFLPFSSLFLSFPMLSNAFRCFQKMIWQREAVSPGCLQLSSVMSWGRLTSAGVSLLLRALGRF
jgi:hypothetical protein